MSVVQSNHLLPDPTPVIATLQAILETGSRWAEVGDNPRTGTSCWGLVWFAFAQAGLTLPASACEADAYFVLTTPPYQAWDVVMADFSGMAHGPRHVGVLMAPTWGYHISRATNGIARFEMRHPLWQRLIKHVWRLRCIS